MMQYYQSTNKTYAVHLDPIGTLVIASSAMQSQGHAAGFKGLLLLVQKTGDGTEVNEDYATLQACALQMYASWDATQSCIIHVCCKLLHNTLSNTIGLTSK